MNPDEQKAAVQELLDRPVWPATLEDSISYIRQHDDTDGSTTKGFLCVHFDRMGDAYISIDDSDWLRFRTYGGGGRSVRVRQALMILAEAIRQENIKDPRP